MTFEFATDWKREEGWRKSSEKTVSRGTVWTSSGSKTDKRKESFESDSLVTFLLAGKEVVGASAAFEFDLALFFDLDLGCFVVLAG